MTVNETEHPVSGSSDDSTFNPGFGQVYGMVRNQDDAFLTHKEGGAGIDEIKGGADPDLILGLDGNDILRGNDGDDEIHGGAGQDGIEGGAGNDSLHGEDGNDKITAGDGDDYVDGGAGGDRLRGGEGSDTFVFAAGTDTDTIRDFEDGVDTIEVNGLGVTAFEQLAIEYGESGAEITVGGDVLRLDGVQEGQLDPNDFDFV